MIDAHHKTETESEYENAKEAVRRYLISEYDLTIVSPASTPNPQTLWRVVWEIVITTRTGDHKVWIAVPYLFPDILPSIYLPEADSYKIPHFNDQKILCTFDTSEAQPNSDLPVEVIKAVIDRAKTLIDGGLLKQNEQDYLQEFDAYWESQAQTKTISIIQISNEPKRVFGTLIEPQWNGFQMLFSDTIDEGKDWLNVIGVSFNKKPEKILYLPIKKFGLPPYPKTNGQMYRRLKEFDPAALSVLMNHLKGNKRPSGVLFNLEIENSNGILGAWWHSKNVHQVFKGKNGKKNFYGVIPGFRNKLFSVKDELATKYSVTKLTQASVERADAERIFTRTNGYKPQILPDAVNIIGCGAVGSQIAARLADSGTVEKFRLIDSDTLKIENVARHYCGMSYINQNKPNAVAGKLRNHYPHIHCERFNQNVLNIIRSDPGKLLPASLTVIAVAEIAVERRINNLFKSSKEFSFPHCYVWVEPHLMGGHGLFIQRDGGCFECAFDRQFKFRDRVVSNSEEFSLREAGCRSGYVPYNMLNLQEFIASLTRFILKSLSKNSSETFTWIGDISSAQRLGINIKPQWSGTTPFSCVTKSIEKKLGCNCSSI